jgi:hypothetical protein
MLRFSGAFELGHFDFGHRVILKIGPNSAYTIQAMVATEPAVLKWLVAPP